MSINTYLLYNIYKRLKQLYTNLFKNKISSHHQKSLLTSNKVYVNIIPIIIGVNIEMSIRDAVVKTNSLAS